MSNVITAKQLNETGRLTPFLSHLLQMEPRIRLYPFFGDVEKDKGFFVTRDHIYIPYQLPMVEHDIAHLVELTNPTRWTLPDWGMRRFDEPKPTSGALFAAFAREVRTRAIQLHLVKFNNEKALRESTSYSQLNNPYWVACLQGSCPFGRFKAYRDVEDYNGFLRERVFQSWNLDRIEATWKQRLVHLQHWMEQ